MELLRLVCLYNNSSIIVNTSKETNTSIALLFRNVMYHYVLDGSMPEHKGFAITQKSCFEPFIIKCGLESFQCFPSLKGDSTTFKLIKEMLTTKFNRAMTNDFDQDFEEENEADNSNGQEDDYKSEELIELLREYETQSISLL